MALTYVCSPLSTPTRAEMLANAAKASTYMMKAEQEFGNRAVAPHAYLPFLLDDTAPEERAFGLGVWAEAVSNVIPAWLSTATGSAAA